MLNIHDVFGLCCCTEKEIINIAVNERVPDIVAATLAEHLADHPNAAYQIKRPLVECMEATKFINNFYPEGMQHDYTKTNAGHYLRRAA